MRTKTQTAKTAKSAKGATSARRSTGKAAAANARPAVYVKAKPALDTILDTMRIVVLSKDHGRREGSGPADIYDTMFASKTVADFTSHKDCGKRWLAGAVARGLIDLRK